MTRKTKVMYMHLIENKPALWSDHDQQIVYADTARYAKDRPRTNASLRRDLRQIRRDQQASIRNRKAWGCNDKPGKYGYVRVEVPTP